MNILYFIITLTLFLIASASDMSFRYTFLSYNFVCLFIYLSVYLFIYVWYVVDTYCLSLLYVNRLAKNYIFLCLFSRTPVQGLRGMLRFHCTFLINNLILDLDSIFPKPAFSYKESYLEFFILFFIFFVFLFKIKQK